MLAVSGAIAQTADDYFARFEKQAQDDLQKPLPHFVSAKPGSSTLLNGSYEEDSGSLQGSQPPKDISHIEGRIFVKDAD